MPRAEESVTYPVLPAELAADLSNLESVLLSHETNYDIAAANAEALAAVSRAYNAVLAGGEAEFALSQMRRRMLEEERRARLWDKLSTWSIIGILGVLSVR